MFFILSKALVFLINPLVWIITLFTFGLYTKNRIWSKRCTILGLVLLIILSNKWITNSVFLLWEEQTLEISQIREPFDIAIVLGGYSENSSIRPNGGKLFHFSSHSANRLTQTVELYHLGKVKKIMLSGGSSNVIGNKLSESNQVEKFLLRLGIPKRDIILESRSRNTYENALYCKRVLVKDYLDNEEQKILLVTSAYHMHRAKKCFDKVGLITTPFSTDFIGSNRNASFDDLVPSGRELSKWKMLIKEWIGLLVYRLNGQA